MLLLSVISAGSPALASDDDTAAPAARATSVAKPASPSSPSGGAGVQSWHGTRSYCKAYACVTLAVNKHDFDFRCEALAVSLEGLDRPDHGRAIRIGIHNLSLRDGSTTLRSTGRLNWNAPAVTSVSTDWWVDSLGTTRRLVAHVTGLRVRYQDGFLSPLDPAIANFVSFTEDSCV